MMSSNRPPRTVREQLLEGIEKRKQEEREKSLRVSEACYQFMQKNGMTAHYPEWQAKEKGAAPGVVLLGNTKSGAKKKVYVKRYEKIFMSAHKDEDILDLAVFTIIKKCGGRVPKVKLKGIADDQVYLFSTDVSQAQSKHPQRKYKFHEFSDDDINVTTYSSIRSKHGIFNHHRDFVIDKVSVARMLLLGMMLNVWDLHYENAGIIFSSEGNAKLTFIDFLIYAEPLQNDCGLDLDGFVRVYYTNMILDKNLNTLMSVITLEDFIEAFKKIEINFHASCKKVMEDINQLPFIAYNRKLHMSAILKIWEQNYLLLQKMVVKAQKESSIFAKLK